LVASPWAKEKTGRRRKKKEEEKRLLTSEGEGEGLKRISSQIEKNTPKSIPEGKKGGEKRKRPVISSHFSKKVDI